MGKIGNVLIRVLVSVVFIVLTMILAIAVITYDTTLFIATFIGIIALFLLYYAISREE